MKPSKSASAVFTTALALVGLFAVSMPATVAAEQAAVPPTDFIAQADQLSQPVFPSVTTTTVTVPAFDGAELYLEITKPDAEAYGNGPWPVILEASPYHGTIATRIGDRMFPDPKDPQGKALGLTGYFAPRGYAVAMMDLRGTGRSDGCLDHLGPNDARDLKTVIEWLADQAWSNGKIGMTGHSYVGSTPSVAAAQAPRGLATIVPSAGLASMYDHQFQKGVPWNLQYIGPMVAYEALALNRDLPSQVPMQVVPSVGSPAGDNFDENGPNPQTGCGLQHSAAISGTGQLTGQYELWHAKRDHRAGAAEADIPIFLIHGVNDNAARIPAAEWFLNGRFERDNDKLWIGQWDHGSTNGRCGDEATRRVSHPTCRFDQMQYAIHAWFDKHLAGRDVDTGPAVEAFLNGEQPLNVAQVSDPETWGTKVLTADAWRRPAVRMGLYPDARDGSLNLAAPDGVGKATLTSASAVAASTTGTVRFASDPLAEDTVFLGLPKLQLNVSQTTSQIAHVVVRVYRENAQGAREPINFCAIQPQLRYGVSTIAPVVPGEEMPLPLSCFTMASWVPAGQSIVMEVASASPHHATFNSEAQLTVHTGPDKSAYAVPVVPGATLFNDVPLREQ